MISISCFWPFFVITLGEGRSLINSKMLHVVSMNRVGEKLPPGRIYVLAWSLIRKAWHNLNVIRHFWFFRHSTYYIMIADHVLGLDACTLHPPARMARTWHGKKPVPKSRLEMKIHQENQANLHFWSIIHLWSGLWLHHSSEKLQKYHRIPKIRGLQILKSQSGVCIGSHDYFLTLLCAVASQIRLGAWLKRSLVAFGIYPWILQVKIPQ